MIHDLEQAIICILGLGYAGLPLAEAFSKSFKAIGFDTDIQKVKHLNQQTISTDSTKLTLTDNPREIAKADFIIIAVPTPVTKSKEPDLPYVRSAA